MSKSYNNTTAILLKRQLNQGIQAGDSLPQLAERVSDVYAFSDKARAKAIAHTESFYAANEANREAYRQSGIVKTIKWYTADSDACQFCAPLNGKTIGLEEVFFKKGETYVGSQGGKLNLDYRAIDVPPVHTNCRCFVQADEISITGKDVEVDVIKEIDDILKDEGSE